MKILVKNIFTLLAVSAAMQVMVGCNATAKKDNNAISGNAYVTTFNQSQLLQQSSIDTVTATGKEEITISIDTTKTNQTMDGFGYTLTGGSAMLLSKMNDTERSKVLQEFFGTENNQLGVSYLRISIGSSDLDDHTFSYDDMEDGKTDEALEKFSLGYDTLYLVPVLQQIVKIAPGIKILGSPWSPPTWMKSNNNTKGGSLKKEYYQAYANYFVKYINAMKGEGITIDAITVQNEPLHPGNNPSMLMLPEEQKEFVRDNLGPTFEKEGISTKIIVYDHNADRPDYPISILDDAAAAKYIDGSAFHLYGGEVSAISRVHEAHPTKNLYFTEQWVGAPGNFYQEMKWHTENLIIGASRNWCKTVLEWNLAADENQDPHTVGGCTKCLGAITITGNTIERNPAYYIIGQASRFVPSGSVRLTTENFKNLPNVAFKTPEGKVVVIAQNNSDKAQSFKINVASKAGVVSIPAQSVATYVLNM